jgi:hypothetical protein
LFRCTPELGIHRAVVDQTGAVILSENQLGGALKNSLDEETIREAIAALLGSSWDYELNRFRSVDLQEIAHLRAI